MILILNFLFLARGAVKDATKWFTCQKGHSYAIGDCGQPRQLGKCPCGAKIGYFISRIYLIFYFVILISRKKFYLISIMIYNYVGLFLKKIVMKSKTIDLNYFSPSVARTMPLLTLD